MVVIILENLGTFGSERFYFSKAILIKIESLRW